ncbi:MAG: hypothetical protein IJM44_02025 [Ruminococcus sp.]|nr:hypothetical protein [Ruminococcus sp.]
MKEKTRFRTSKLLLILAVLSLIIATTEGLIYYQHEELFFKLLLVLQNGINAFAFKPTITLKDAIAFMHKDPTPLRTGVSYAYGVAVFTAPYCTFAFVYRTLEKLLRFVFNLKGRRKSENIVIFGYNSEVRSMIANYAASSAKGRNINIITSEELTSEERFGLSRNGCRVHSFNVLKADEEELHYLLKKAGTDRADNIVIFGESSVSNFSVLQMFSLRSGDGGFVLKRGAKITCRCEDDSINELIADYYKVGKNERYGYDLDIVSLPELQVGKMFSETPLHTVYLDTDKNLRDWDVKMLILGFGTIGQQTLLQALDLSVVHSSNSVVIDVYDKDITSKMEIFTNRLSFDTFVQDGSTIRLSKKAADGSLTINCHNLNVKFREFIETIKTSNADRPYTYAVIAIDDVSTGVNCAMRLANVFSENGSTNTPIILRMDSDRRLAKYINKNDRTFSGVRLLEDKSRVLDLDLILSKDIDRVAKDFHCFYSGIMVLSRDEEAWKSEERTADELWTSTSLFKRESSKALAAHEYVKRVAVERLARELGISDIDAKIDSLIGENGSLMKYDGRLWRLPGTEEELMQGLMQDSFAREIASLEHRRWCCFVASQGWKNGSERSDDKKVHTCLMPFSELAADERGRTTIKYDLMSLMARYLRNNKP